MTNKKNLIKDYLKVITWTIKNSFKISPSFFILQFIATIFDGLMPMFDAFILGATVSAVTEGIAGNTNAYQKIWLYLGLAFTAGLIEIFKYGLISYYRTKFNNQFDIFIYKDVAKKFINLDFQLYDDSNKAESIDRAKDFSRSLSRIFDSINYLARGLIRATTAIITIISIDWKIGLLMSILLVPNGFLGLKMIKNNIKSWRDSSKTNVKRYWATKALSEKSYLPEVRMSHAGNYIIKIWEELSNILMNENMKQAKNRFNFTSKKWLYNLIFKTFGMVLIIKQIITKKSPIGSFIYARRALDESINGLNNLIETFTTMQEDVLKSEDFISFLNYPNFKSGDRKIDNFKKCLNINNLTFKYNNSSEIILNNINLSIKKGEKIALVGENGAGKSTLIKLIMNLYDSNDKITLDDVYIQDYRADDYYKLFAVMNQDVIEYNFASLKDNITIGKPNSKFDKNQYQKSIKYTGIDKIINNLPSGEDSMLSPWLKDKNGKSGVELSGGQKQRVALARSFYRDSDIIILDEPTSAIDAMAESKIFNHIFEDNSKTIIVVSHRLSTIKKADKIYVMKNGEITEQGTYKELFKDGTYFHELFKSQA